jgi:uncharacterized damage-inducible protein DinB
VIQAGSKTYQPRVAATRQLALVGVDQHRVVLTGLRYITDMLAMLHDLVQHKHHANAALLSSIAAHEKAAADPELRRLLHHIILANRFWLALFTGSDFDEAKEGVLPESLRAVESLYRDVSNREAFWIGGLQASDLERNLATPFIPDRSFSVAQALIQVCLHSHGHRAQCAVKLRELGGNPPPMDFITLLEKRPAADWPD